MRLVPTASGLRSLSAQDTTILCVRVGVVCAALLTAPVLGASSSAHYDLVGHQRTATLTPGAFEPGMETVPPRPSNLRVTVSRP